jgi:hypothetical protein
MTMKNGMIIEIAVRGMERIDLAQYGLQSRVDHYWRTRWIEDGEEADQVCEINDLAGMERQARAAGEMVAWRYYETDVFVDEDEQRRFVEAHNVTEALMDIAPIFGER